jgi:hypothetical protein
VGRCKYPYPTLVTVALCSAGFWHLDSGRLPFHTDELKYQPYHSSSIKPEARLPRRRPWQGEAIESIQLANERTADIASTDVCQRHAKLGESSPRIVECTKMRKSVGDLQCQDHPLSPARIVLRASSQTLL